MRSPADMQTIQIDITNACNKACSNCTRFCGNHKKPFFMNYDTFRRAVDSLEGFDGVIGVMGGEPTLHPEFERFVAYLRGKYAGQDAGNPFTAPQRRFIKEIHRREGLTHVLRETSKGDKVFKMSGPGLWSNMSEPYRKHYELIQDSFNVQFLNDHINASFHQPGLVARKDLGIPDDQWIPLRDKCWIQNEWSATITPKGAFFCEVAGALDMLFDGPGGWKIEPGWWKRTPEEFGDQLHWCELCGFALDTFMRDAGEETDDVSSTLYAMLENAGSPRLEAGKTKLIQVEKGRITEDSRPSMAHLSPAQPYIEHYEDRFNENNSILFVHEYAEISIPSGKDFGVRFNQALKDAKEWVLFRTDPEADSGPADDLIKKYILNPGTLHLGNGFALLSKNALSLREFGFDRIAHTSDFQDIIDAWKKDKVFHLADLDKEPRGLLRRTSIQPDKRYAVWGTGLCGGFMAEAVVDSGAQLVFCIDRDSSKNGMDFYGSIIHEPQYLQAHGEDYDLLILAHYTRFQEIRDEALRLGVPQEKILMPYEV